MLLLEIAFEVRTSWNNGVEVEIWMRCEIVHFDMLHIETLFDTRSLVEISAVVHQIGKLTDFLLITLEISHIDLIKAN